jgi:amidase
LDQYSDDGDLAVIGPLARSAEDLQLVMDIIARPKAPERVAYRLALPPPRRKALSDFRVGLWLDDPASPVDAIIGERIQALADALAAAGVNVKDRRPDIEFTHSHDVYTRLLYAAQSADLPDHLYGRAQSGLPKLDDNDKSYRAQWVRGTAMSHRDWARLNQERLLLRQRWADFFKDHDVLLCPVVGVTAFAHDHRDIFERTLLVNGKTRSYLDTLLPWAGLVTVSSLPSTVVPVGLAKDGLPVGVQVVGPYLEDRTTIHFARLIRELVGGFQVPCKS